MSCIKQKSEPVNLSNKTDNNTLSNKFGFKRKLQSNDNNEEEKENNSEMNEKRLRLVKEIDNRIDIDDLLSSYSSNANNQNEQKSENKDTLSSPLLTRVIIKNVIIISWMNNIILIKKKEVQI